MNSRSLSPLVVGVVLLSATAHAQEEIDGSPAVAIGEGDVTKESEIEPTEAQLAQEDLRRVRYPLPEGSLVTSVGILLPRQVEAYATVVTGVLEELPVDDVTASDLMRVDRFAVDIARATRVIGGVVVAVEPTASDFETWLVIETRHDLSTPGADVVERVRVPPRGGEWNTSVVGTTVILPCDPRGSLLMGARMTSLVDGDLFYLGRGLTISEATIVNTFGVLK